MKADQKYSKVVGINVGGGGVYQMNETEGAIKGGGLYQWNQWISGTVKKLHIGSLHFNSYRFLWSIPSYLNIKLFNEVLLQLFNDVYDAIPVVQFKEYVSAQWIHRWKLLTQRKAK